MSVIVTTYIQVCVCIIQCNYLFIWIKNYSISVAFQPLLKHWFSKLACNLNSFHSICNTNVWHFCSYFWLLIKYHSHRCWSLDDCSPFSSAKITLTMHAFMLCNLQCNHCSVYSVLVRHIYATCIAWHYLKNVQYLLRQQQLVQQIHNSKMKVITPPPPPSSTGVLTITVPVSSSSASTAMNNNTLIIAW